MIPPNCPNYVKYFHFGKWFYAETIKYSLNNNAPYLVVSGYDQKNVKIAWPHGQVLPLSKEEYLIGSILES